MGVPKNLSSIHPNGYNECTQDPEGAIPDIRMILRLGIKYDFPSLTAAVRSTLAQHAIDTPSALSRLVKRMKKGCNGEGPYYEVCRMAWGTHLRELLGLAHGHKIFTMLPGIYYLFLALDGPTRLSKNGELSNADRLRCCSGFHALHCHVYRLAVGRTYQPHGDDSDHQTLWLFPELKASEQENVWELLPHIFQFTDWNTLQINPNLDVTMP